MSAMLVDLQTADGTLDLHLCLPAAAGGPRPAVLLYMDAFGIRADLLDMARRLASHGYVVAVPNLYYRTPFAPFSAKAVAADSPERDRFKGMIASIGQAMVMRDTGAVIAWLDENAAVRRGPFAALGYCMGGGYALSAAAFYPERFSLAASFHGGSLATDKPESPHRLAARIKARVYVGAAEIDPSFPPEQQTRLSQAFDESGGRYTLEIYQGAKHGFAVNGHLVYDRDASERHWARLLRLLEDEVQSATAVRTGV